MDSPTPHRGLRIAVVAIVELANALSSVQNVFTDYHHATAPLRFAQALTSLHVAVPPFHSGFVVLVLGYLLLLPELCPPAEPLVPIDQGTQPEWQRGQSASMVWSASKRHSPCYL